MAGRKILALLAVAGVAAAPASAEARRGHDGLRHAAAKARQHKRARVPYEFAGVVKAVDASAGTLTVTVRQANRHGRSFRGQDVTFDVSHARLVVRDVNHDGSRDLGDVAAGDRAVVLALLPRDASYDASATYQARGAVVRHRKHAPPPADGGGDVYQDPLATT